MIAGVCGQLFALFTVLFLSSMLVAVTPIASSAVLDEVAPAGFLTTAYTAMVGCGLLTSSAGTALAGTVAQHHGPATAYALAAAAATTTALWVTARRNTLHRATPEKS